MAKQDSKLTGAGQIKVKFKGYVNYDVTEDDKLQLRAMLSEGVDPLTDMAEVVAEDYKISLAIDRRSGAYVATLYCQNPNLPNVGLALTMRAKLPEDAFRRVLFVHRMVFKTIWPNSGTPSWTDEKW